MGACEERGRGFGRLTKDGADATRPDLRRRDQTSRRPTHNSLLTQSGRQPTGGRQDCMRGAVEHSLPLRATDDGPDSSLRPTPNCLVATSFGPDLGGHLVIGCHRRTGPDSSLRPLVNCLVTIPDLGPYVVDP
ncbi:hypothetical protein ISCGN_028333 [Ixodes scapularis]